jgi:predicted MFS family arabinose efflux permease
MTSALFINAHEYPYYFDIMYMCAHVQEATGVLLTFGAGNAVGVVLGGLLGHFLYKRDVRYPPLVMGTSILLGCLPMWYIIDAVSYSESNVGVASMAMFVAGALTILPIPIERAILANVTLPETRGRANAFLNMIDDLGKGFGPYVLSQIIAKVGRESAFKLSLIGWLIGGTISLCVFFTGRQDETTVQETITQRLNCRRDYIQYNGISTVVDDVHGKQRVGVDKI